ncbi:SPOR domain-containing protein [Microbacterium marinilacus]|uniref:SPOR domain-containing protein n=1 Tax=Microbacterium marinilacus TaxID=415209 RepID=A0ABP7BI76_9MICO|nr:SPOR domain-containing protein [Microbacterium marinilacus]MBY0688474.1 SPOR domain-containing protein [Microbacterium marinilacus]
MSNSETPDEIEKSYWYNARTGEVEHGPESPAIDRVGPFETAEEAARAPEVLKARSKAWAEDEEREKGWGAGTP